MFFLFPGPCFWLWCQMDGSWGAGKQPKQGSTTIPVGCYEISASIFSFKHLQQRTNRKHIKLANILGWLPPCWWFASWRGSTLWKIRMWHHSHQILNQDQLGYNYRSGPHCFDGRISVDSGGPDDMTRCIKPLFNAIFVVRGADGRRFWHHADLGPGRSSGWCHVDGNVPWKVVNSKGVPLILVKSCKILVEYEIKFTDGPFISAKDFGLIWNLRIPNHRPQPWEDDGHIVGKLRDEF